VLVSPDGLTWTKSAELALPWSVQLNGVSFEGSNMLIQGVEYICDASPGAMNSFSLGAQSRLWSSTDGGATWAGVDLATTGVADDVPAPPADPGSCPTFSERSAYNWGFGMISEADGTFAVSSSDGSRISTTTDFTAWSVADVPSGAPTDAATQTIVGPRPQRLIVNSDQGLTLLSLEPRRDSTGAQIDYGRQIFGWSSNDAGVSWQQLPTTRPLTPDRVGTLTLLTDGSLAMIAAAADSVGLAAYLSEAGPLLEWDTCVPAAGVDCSFATLDATVDVAGLDLSGIDLRGSDLSQAIFDGATLTGAKLDGAVLTGASFAGANLSGVSLRGLQLGLLDLGDADLTGADLSEATVSASVLTNPTLAAATLTEVNISFSDDSDASGASLAGVNLRGASFLGKFGGLSSMRGANFSGADLRGASFSYLDLTGADFSGADLGEPSSTDTVVFGTDLVCPDGAAPTPGAFGAPACRL
jgi:uncharacterized protein YjbI with pentapeptide repeats